MENNNKNKIRLYAINLLIVVFAFSSPVLLFSPKLSEFVRHFATSSIIIIIALLFIFSLSIFFSLISEKDDIINKKDEEIKKYNEELKKIKQSLKEKENEDTSKEKKSQITFDDIIPKEIDLVKFCDNLLINISKKIEIGSSLVYLKTNTGEYQIRGSYAFLGDPSSLNFKEGVGINGQVMKNSEATILENIPNSYLSTGSGLGKSTPNYVYIIPILEKSTKIGLIEISSFKNYKEEIELLKNKFSEIASILKKLSSNA